MEEYKGSGTALVADVDCTAAGKDLCETHGVRGYPSIKWGDPSSMEDYEGGRTLADLQKWSAENLKPVCSPANLDLCDDDKKKEIKDLQAMPADDLAAKIEEKKGEIKTAEDTFSDALKELQAKYERLQKEKDEGIAAIKASGLGLMSAVLASKDVKKDEL